MPDMTAGGAQRVMAQLCNHFAAQGHETTLMLHPPALLQSFYPLLDAVRLAPLWNIERVMRLGRGMRVIGRVVSARQQIAVARPDVVISFLDQSNVRALLSTRGMNVPVIVSERVDPQARLRHVPAIWRLARKLTYPFASRIVVQTARAAKFFHRYPPSRIVSMPNPIPAATLMAQSAQRGSDGRWRLIGVGRLDHQKGFDILIESFAGLASSFPDWDAVIYGQGPDREALLAQIEHHGLSGRIELMDVTKDIAGELARSHIMVFPSRYEGFPNALAEAMAAALPAVGFADVSGVEDLITHGETGLLARWDDGADQNPVRSLTECLGQLMSSAELRVRMGEAARDSLDSYRPEIVLGKWDQLVADVVNEHAGT